jgi:hypothetical protein
MNRRGYHRYHNFEGALWNFASEFWRVSRIAF